MTIDSTAKVFPVTITMRHHAWVTWADIAIRHEAFAKEARAGGDVYEYRPGLVTLTSAAFSLDALYDAVKELVPDDPGIRGARSRAGVPLGGTEERWSPNG
jgi:hypothetical protein